MKREFRAHPLMLVRLLKPFLFVLVLPVLEGAVQYLTRRSFSHFFILELLAVSLILLLSFLRWRRFRFSVDERELTVCQGAFFREKTVIPLGRLSAVTLCRNPFDTLFSAVTVAVSTEAGMPGRADYEFKLSRRDGEELLRRLYGDELRAAVRFSTGRLAASAALTSSAVTGLVIGVPLLDRLGKVFGRAYSRMLFDEINSVSGKFNTYFPPIFNAVILVLLIAYAVSFVYSFIRALNFRLFAGKERLEVHSGLFVRRRAVFQRDAVRDISVEQTLPMYLAHRYMLCVTVAGFDTSRDGRAVVIPCCAADELNGDPADGLPFFSQSGRELRPARGRASLLRFLRVPLAAACGLAVLTLIAMLTVPYFERFILLVSAVLLLFDCYAALYFRYGYRFGRLRFGETLYVRAARGFGFCELYIPRENVGIIRLTRGHADRRRGTCNVRVTVRSERGNRLRVWHLDYRAVRENIFSYFELD